MPAIRNEVGVAVVQDCGVYFLRVCVNGDILLEESSKGTKDERKTVKALLELSYNVIAQNHCRITLNVLLCNSSKSNGIHVSQRNGVHYYKYLI
jgi:hypothetical protein